MIRPPIPLPDQDSRHPHHPGQGCDDSRHGDLASVVPLVTAVAVDAQHCSLGIGAARPVRDALSKDAT